MAIKLIAFDFDGTLVDTAPDICRATNEFLLLHKREELPYPEIMEHIGQGLVGLIRGVVPEAEHHPELIQTIESQFEKIYDQYVLNEPKPFDGVEEFLFGTSLKLAIVSNKPERYIHLLLRHLGWNEIPWVKIVGGDTFAEKKPHPMPLQQVLHAAGVQPKECLMVGDGPPDVGVAQAVGAHFLAVSFGYSPLAELKSLGAEHAFSHFRELPHHVDALAMNI